MGQMSINSMALPPIINYGTEAMKDEVVRAVVRGDKNICLAISEPTAGSDVARIQTTAVLEGILCCERNKEMDNRRSVGDWFTMAVERADTVWVVCLFFSSSAPRNYDSVRDSFLNLPTKHLQRSIQKNEDTVRYDTQHDIHHIGRCPCSRKEFDRTCGSWIPDDCT